MKNLINSVAAVMLTAGMLTAGMLTSCGKAKQEVETVRFLIDSIQSQMVPDSRVAVFSVRAAESEGQILLTGKSTEPAAIDELTRHLGQQGIHYTDSIIRLPEKELGNQLFGLVTISVANIRSNPAQSAELATQAILGTPVRILETDNGYFLIQTPDNYISHVETGAIAPRTKEEMDLWRGSDRIIFTGDYSLIYSEPDENSVPVSDVVMGSILVRNQSASHGFTGVDLPDGRKGFVTDNQWKSFREWLNDNQFDPTEIAHLARKFTGRPYLWGGTSAKGMDCSGYTKTLYFMSGFILSRDASQQVNQGIEIDAGQVWKGLQTGDLLFFGRKATAEKSERATHVGMYLGDSWFIHSTPSMIRINSLDSTRPGFRKYYLEIMLHVKRMAGVQNEPVRIINHPWYN